MNRTSRAIFGLPVDFSLTPNVSNAQKHPFNLGSRAKDPSNPAQGPRTSTIIEDPTMQIIHVNMQTILQQMQIIKHYDRLPIEAVLSLLPEHMQSEHLAQSLLDRVYTQ